jgi:hypothetical protein
MSRRDGPVQGHRGKMGAGKICRYGLRDALLLSSASHDSRPVQG